MDQVRGPQELVCRANLQMDQSQEMRVCNWTKQFANGPSSLQMDEIKLRICKWTKKLANERKNQSKERNCKWIKSRLRRGWLTNRHGMLPEEAVCHWTKGVRLQMDQIRAPKQLVSKWTKSGARKNQFAQLVCKWTKTKKCEFVIGLSSLQMDPVGCK